MITESKSKTKNKLKEKIVISLYLKPNSSRNIGRVRVRLYLSRVILVISV